MPYQHPTLLQDPHILYPVDDLNLNFSDYIFHNKEIIKKYRLDLQNHNKELIIEANAPFELIPEHPIYSEKNTGKIKTGALLIHGLLDSPFIMRDIGEKLQSQGILVRAILLPGHGTVPGSLLNTQYEEWTKTVQYGVELLKKETEKIFLVGYSTGASLCVYQTLQDASHIAGLILLSPAFKIKSSFDFATNWHKVISSRWPRAQWLHSYKEIDYTKYLSMPLNAAYQVYRLTQVLKKINHTKEPPCPIWIALSFDDKIVCSKSTIQYFCQYSHPKNRMLLYATHHQYYQDPRIMVRKSSYPEWHIINFSHPAIPVSPQNPHYGIAGDCPLASHINEKNNILYRELDKPAEIFYDLLYRLKLIKYQQKRLSFNPDFELMANEINHFIKQN